VRGDYSADGVRGALLPARCARSRAPLGEDGLLWHLRSANTTVLRDRLWNGRDPISRNVCQAHRAEGNHGEDVKESYFHLIVATHSTARPYKYPKPSFPTRNSSKKDRRRTSDAEFELSDTGVSRRPILDVDVEGTPRRVPTTS
jgi:hypothetical protein